MENNINYWRFKEGLLDQLCYRPTQGPEETHDEFMERKGREGEALIRGVEENWWFCGGRDTDPYHLRRGVKEDVLDGWARLWSHYFPSRPMPPEQHLCVCRQEGLRYECFITDGVRVFTIGRICLGQFLPKQDKHVGSKRCHECVEPHRNRKDTYCSPCRVIRKERALSEAREAEEAIQQQYLREAQEAREAWMERTRVAQEAREAEEALRREEQRVAQEAREAEEALRREREARQCGCGGWKPAQYPSCWECRSRRLADLSPMERRKVLCGCGKVKKAQYAKCFTCNQSARGAVTA